MTKEKISTQSPDPTQELTVTIPRRLAERVTMYAGETDNTISGVVIEALAEFLRGIKK